LLSLGYTRKPKDKNKYYRNGNLLFHRFIPPYYRKAVPVAVGSLHAPDISKSPKKGVKYNTLLTIVDRDFFDSYGENCFKTSLARAKYGTARLIYQQMAVL